MPKYDHSVVSQVRIDLRDLGYPPVDVIPPANRPFARWRSRPDGRLYGATSGDRAHLFVLDPRHGYVVPLGRLPDKTVHHALAVGADGDVYIGGAPAVDNNGEGYANYPGGHLLKYAPKGESASIRIDADCPVEDLGIPVEGPGHLRAADGPQAGVIYGAHLSGRRLLQLHRAASGVFKTHGRVAKARRCPARSSRTRRTSAARWWWTKKATSTPAAAATSSAFARRRRNSKN